jgi:hypothetical protein
MVMILTVKSLAVAGDFTDRTTWLFGEGKSLARAKGAWHEVRARLLASPPSAFWAGRTGPVWVRLAEYTRRCTAPSDRLLVLWYAPEIYHDADRMMAGLHLYYFSEFRDLEFEQRRELDTVRKYAPPLILANRNNYQAAVDAFPPLLRYIESEYATAASFEEDGDGYRILVRKDSPPRATDAATGWPCFR